MAEEYLLSYNFDNCKVVIESELGERFIIFTRKATSGIWLLCVTDGKSAWRLSFNTSVLEEICRKNNLLSRDDFKSRFRDGLQQGLIKVIQSKNKVIVSFSSGMVIEIPEASSADAKSDVQYILFLYADSYTECCRKLQSNSQASPGKNKSFSDIGPKMSSCQTKVKLSKEGMSAVNPRSKKRKAAQGVIYS